MERTWRIGEVAERTGLTRRTLRHYDELGLLVPSGRSWSDYRLYDEDDLLRLLQIQNLKALGLSLAEIADALADPELDAGATLRTHLARLEQQIADEQELAGRLRRLAEADDRSWEDVLAAIAAGWPTPTPPSGCAPRWAQRVRPPNCSMRSPASPTPPSRRCWCGRSRSGRTPPLPSSPDSTAPTPTCAASSSGCSARPTSPQPSRR